MGAAGNKQYCDDGKRRHETNPHYSAINRIHRCRCCLTLFADGVRSLSLVRLIITVGIVVRQKVTFQLFLECQQSRVGDPIDKQFSIQVIELVLKNCREEVV